MTMLSERIRRGPACPVDAAISVILLVLHEASAAARCLDSIALSTTLHPEFIVVANGTSDRGLQPLAHRDDITLVRLEVNIGFGRGCNLGATLATGAHLVFLNDDATVEAGWLEGLVAAVRDRPNVGAVGSKVLFPDGRLQDAGGILWRDGTSSRIGWHEPDRPAPASLRDVDYCSGCSMLVPRSAWIAAGGFDSQFFPAYYEDADLCMRLRQLGLRILCQPESRVRHEESASSTADWRMFMSERNRARFIERWSDVLATHEARPAGDPSSLEAGVAAAIARVNVEAA